jgi:hypothetical protein
MHVVIQKEAQSYDDQYVNSYCGRNCHRSEELSGNSGD